MSSTEDKNEIFPICNWLGSIDTALVKFENTFLFLSSTLILHENEALGKQSSNRRKWKLPALHFIVDGKHFENRAFQNQWHHNSYMISVTEFSSNTNSTWPVIVVFSNIWGIAWLGPYMSSTKAKNSFLLMYHHQGLWLVVSWAQKFRITQQPIYQRHCPGATSSVWNFLGPVYWAIGRVKSVAFLAVTNSFCLC